MSPSSGVGVFSESEGEREIHLVGWIGEKSMCRHLVCVGVFSESERRDIWMLPRSRSKVRTFDTLPY